MRVGDYVRTRDGHIGRITFIYDLHIGLNDNNDYSDKPNIELDNWDECFTKNNIIKSSPNILKLLEPMDLLYVDIDGGFEGGIIVPRIPETQNELNEFIELIKSGHWILKGIVTHEQLKSIEYEVE